MTTLNTDDHLRDVRELPGRPRQIVVTVAGRVVERSADNDLLWTVHHEASLYRVALTKDEIGRKGYDLALFDAVAAVPSRGYRVA